MMHTKKRLMRKRRKLNGLKARPDEHTSGFGGFTPKIFERHVGRKPTKQDFVGVHTTGDFARAAVYAWGAYQVHREEPDNAPVIITLDTNGLEAHPDYDAILETHRLIDSTYLNMLREYGKNVDRAIHEELSDAEVDPSRGVQASIMEQPLSIALAFSEVFRDSTVLQQQWTRFLDTGKVPDEVMSALVDQRRYLQDIEEDRVVEIWKLKPLWPDFVDYEEDDGEEFDRLQAEGYQVFTLDEVGHVEPDQTLLWRRPGPIPRDLQYHGTDVVGLSGAFPGLVKQR